MSEDASATYRGFRNQALYVLSRLLTDSEASEHVYRPEGAEDLAVFDSHMHLVEVVQVKDYSSDLALSHFKPKSDEGFFARLKRRRKAHPKCTTKLATFGKLGVEFEGAISGEAQHRRKFVEKLCASNGVITADDAEAMLDGLKGNVIHPKEADLFSSVTNALRETNVAGALQQSLELLMYWIFDASEKQRDLTRTGLLLQLERIGDYLAGLRDSSSEWETSVSPLRSLTLSAEDAQRWITEYRNGVQARWEHIEAGADCSRTARLLEIHRELEKHPVVIIRGASGQGKSSLGWRYLHDYCAEGARFHVRLVENREHALKVANALNTHVKRLNLNAIAYFDVSPSDAGWSELIKQLVSAGLKVIVAVREEDFRRANVAVGDFDYSEVIVDRVTKEEAEPIYDALRLNGAATTLDFEEAWARFASHDGGPLLAFTHLVSQGDSLGSRIASQIRRLQEDAAAKANGVSERHLELLALAAIANEAGARVRLNDLCDEVEIGLLTRPLKVLEEEYLVRIQTQDSDTSISGLHALRSKAVVDALFADSPQLWKEYAIRVLPLIIDDDIDAFLLAAFSRRGEFSQLLLEQLCSLPPRSWGHAARIARALIWEGVNRYEQLNRETLSAAIAQFDGAWWFACDSFVGMNGDEHQKLVTTLNNTLPTQITPVSLTSKASIFEPLADWAHNVTPPSVPQTLRDWAGVGDISHWLAHATIVGPLRAAIEGQIPPSTGLEIPVEELGAYVSGRVLLGDSTFLDWHDKLRAQIKAAFLTETDSVHVADNGTEVKVFYSVQVADSVIGDKSDSANWNAQTMKRVRLLRRLFPDRHTYSGQGVGLEFLLGELGHDPTAKCIPAASLPLERSVHLNATFGRLVAYRHNRPDAWIDYVTAVVAFRETVSACFRKLYRGWSKLLSEASPRQSTISGLPGAEIDRVNKLAKLPMFPRCAVDEWGLISEEQQAEIKSGATMQERSLRRFDAWRKAFRDFETGVEMVVSKILNITVVYLAEHKGHTANAEEEQTVHLMLVNLGISWESLHAMQQEFRAHFSRFVARDLDELEEHERSNFRHLWAVAFAMRYERRRVVSDIVRIAEAENARRATRFLNDITQNIRDDLGEGCKVSVPHEPWVFADTMHLCVVCDHQTLVAMEDAIPKIVEAVWRAAQAGGWRNLEWKPLAIRWPRIAFVNLVLGKALAPACAIVSTEVLFAASETFEAKFHHYAMQQVEPAAFAKAGFLLWENPLLRSALHLRGAVLAFVLTHARFPQLATLAFEQGLDQVAVDRVLAEYSRELRTVLTDAQRSYAETSHILTTLSDPRKAAWLPELARTCGVLLLEVNETANISITLDRFADWQSGFTTANEGFQRLMTEIMQSALL